MELPNRQIEIFEMTKVSFKENLFDFDKKGAKMPLVQGAFLLQKSLVKNFFEKREFMSEKSKKKGQTTDIFFDDYYHTVTIITYNYKLKKKLAKFYQEHPECCRKIYEDDDGGVRYEVEKSRMSIRFISPCSEEKKEMYRNIINTINHKEGDSM